MWAAKWTPSNKMIPAEDGLYTVITESGDERELYWRRNLWWLPDLSMYVYFTPIFWKRKDPS